MITPPASVAPNIYKPFPAVEKHGIYDYIVLSSDWIEQKKRYSPTRKVEIKTL